METIDIYECKDHRDFLRRSLLANKSVGMRGLAKKAGFKSAGLLSMLIKGDRNLTIRSAEMLARAMKLKGKQRNMLITFARLDSARTGLERRSAQEALLKLKSYRPEYRIQTKQFSFLATWYYPVIYSMIENLESHDSARIAICLGRGVTSASVEQAFADLQELELIKKDASGKWQQTHKAISTPEDMKDFAIEKYHRNMNSLAEEALQLPLDRREFNGLTISIPEKLLPQVKEKVRKLRIELNEMLSQEKSQGDIYQVNLQVFPLTNGLERSDL